MEQRSPDRAPEKKSWVCEMILVSAGVVVLNAGKILAIGASPKNPEGYGLPFGKALEGEAAEVCALRELEEETGVHAVGDLTLLFTEECEGHRAVAFRAHSVSGELRSSREGVPVWVQPAALLLGRYKRYNAGVLHALGLISAQALEAHRVAP